MHFLSAIRHLIFVPLCLVLRSQDTIYFRNQTVELAKILEIGLQEVRYRRWDNLAGPLFIKNKNDILSIIYENGQRDTFRIQSLARVSEAVNLPAGFRYIQIIPGGLYYEGYPLNERGLIKLIRNYPEGSKQSLMYSEFERMRTFKKRQMNALIIGGGLSIYIPLITTVISLDEAEDPLPFIAGGVLTGAGVALVSHYLYKWNKLKRGMKKEEIARIYNSF